MQTGAISITIRAYLSFVKLFHIISFRSYIYALESGLLLLPVAMFLHYESRITRDISFEIKGTFTIFCIMLFVRYGLKSIPVIFFSLFPFGFFIHSRSLGSFGVDLLSAILIFLTIIAIHKKIKITSIIYRNIFIFASLIILSSFLYSNRGLYIANGVHIQWYMHSTIVPTLLLFYVGMSIRNPVDSIVFSVFIAIFSSLLHYDAFMNLFNFVTCDNSSIWAYCKINTGIPVDAIGSMRPKQAYIEIFLTNNIGIIFSMLIVLSGSSGRISIFKGDNRFSFVMLLLLSSAFLLFRNGSVFDHVPAHIAASYKACIFVVNSFLDGIKMPGSPVIFICGFLGGGFWVLIITIGAFLIDVSAFYNDGLSLNIGSFIEFGIFGISGIAARSTCSLHGQSDDIKLFIKRIRWNRWKTAIDDTIAKHRIRMKRINIEKMYWEGKISYAEMKKSRVNTFHEIPRTRMDRILIFWAFAIYLLIQAAFFMSGIR